MAEVAIFLLEFIANVLVEGAIEFVFEFLTDSAWRGTSRRFKKPVSAATSILLYGLVGAGCGWISLYILPTALVRDPIMQLFVWFGAPLVAATIMAGFGYIRKRRKKSATLLHQFLYAYIFAFCLSSIRFIWAH